MATDYVTSPMTRSGMLLYGLLIGIITASIRRWGIYPEGMSFCHTDNERRDSSNQPLYASDPLFPTKKGGHSMKSTPLTMALSLTSLCLLAGTALAGSTYADRASHSQAAEKARAEALKAVLPTFDNNPMAEATEADGLNIYPATLAGTPVGAAINRNIFRRRFQWSYNLTRRIPFRRCRKRFQRSFPF